MPSTAIPPGILSSRNYPGFLVASLIVLLRISIGWHFLTEGIEKVQSTRYGKNPFSAEGYLRNATGPLAPYFRGLLLDADSKDLLHTEGKDALVPDRLNAEWSESVARIGDHYRFTDEQRAKAKARLEQSTNWAEQRYNNPENRQAREKYFHDLAQVEATEQNQNALSFERERAWESRRELEASRKTLTAPILAQGEELRTAVAALATPEQQAASGPYSAPWTVLDWSNILTMYGLCAIGVCLIVGFLTPLAALAAAAFLAMIYLSIPPWPGLPDNPKTEGHYWIVSKNLIELIACLLIAVSASGYWFGIDRLFFGAGRRRRWARRERKLAEKYGLVVDPGSAREHPGSIPLAARK